MIFSTTRQAADDIYIADKYVVVIQLFGEIVCCPRQRGLLANPLEAHQRT